MRSIFLLPLGILAVFLFGPTTARTHELNFTQQKLLMDTLEKEVENDLQEAQDQLVVEAKGIRDATERYAKAKLAQNIFRALRSLVVKELEEIPLHLRMRQPRQDESDEIPSNSGGDDEDGVETATTSGETASTTKRTVPLIPVLAGILKSVFGGGENNTTPALNVTQTIQTATKLFFPFGLPFQGVSLLRRPTPAPATIIKYYPAPPPPPPLIYPAVESTPKPTATTPVLRLVGRKDERMKREATPIQASNPSIEVESHHTSSLSPQPQTLYSKNQGSSAYAPSYINLIQSTNPPISSTSSVGQPMLIYAPNHLGAGPYAPFHPKMSSISPTSHPTTNFVQTTKIPSKIKAQEMVIPVFAEAVGEKWTKDSSSSTQTPTQLTTTSKSGQSSRESTTPAFTQTPTPGLIYVDSLARDVQNSFDGLVKNLPDILKGAKEAIGLLANLREIFGEEVDDA